MAVVQAPFLVAVLLLVSPGLHCSSPPAACPESCTCQRAALLNCSSSGLSSVPQHIQDSVTGLDLSQNRLDTVTLHRPYRNLRNVWLENNTITHLSLCIDTNLGAQSVRGRHSGGLGLSSRRRCVSWAPALQLLSVERNQLMQLPEGLERSASLWVLQLSFNKISTLRPGELRHLRQLKELHLKHNLITNLHPQMFQDLAQLRVLDLSFNMLTNLHPSMYLSLHNIGSDVRLDGNRWQCDCSMRSLRRRMAYDSNRGLQTWGVVCAFPSVHSGKDLLQLEEDDLNCFGTENSRELHRDVTVYSGSEILLSCSKQDSSWLKPSGQESVSGPQASLFIGDVTDKDTGLYVCMTEDHEVVSVFNLQISRVEHARRKTRSLPRNSRQVIPQIPTNRIGQERNQRATQSDLALAVCLSVFITFLIAFILGVLARPFIDVLCKKVTNKRSPSATNSVSSAEQRQYENEAYSESEEPEEIVTHRERRVTFRTVNIGEDINVEYYDTVASGNKQSVEAAKNEKDEHTAGDSGSENGSRQVNPENNQRDARDISCTTNTRRKHNVQLDNIPDSEKLEERSLSSCSDSSLSDRQLKKDRMNKRDHTSPKSLQRAEDSVQQGADSSTSEILEVEELSIERTREMSEFSSEPFADWSPHADDTRPSDSGLWQENEEQFEFSDSAGSNSERSSSLFGSFNDSRRKVLPTSDIQSRDDVSSCSSSLSADEPTQYTVNPDQEEEDAENNPYKSDFTNTKQDASFQQQISGVDTRRPPAGFNQGNYPHDTLRPAERPEQTSSSQSSDSEQRIVAGEKDTREKIKPTPRPRWRGVSLGVREMHMTSVQFQETQTPSRDSDAHWPALDLENTIRIKRRLDIKAPSPSPDSSSSSDSEDEITGQKEKKRPQKFDHSGLLLKKSQTINLDPDARWPALDLEDIPRIKRRLDVKAPSPPPDSSSSSVSDNETTGHREKKRPQKVHHSGLLLKKSQTANHGPDAKWPAVDLENIPTIKRRLDIDGDTKYPTESPGKVDIVNLPLRKSQTLGHNIHTRWPALDLENIPTIKRRLDVKTPSPPPDSSSSGESDDERTGHTEKKRSLKVHHSGLLLKESQTANRDLDARWPALDLENIPTIKRCLDIKAPSPPTESSSSSDSDDEATHAAERPGKVGNAALPLQKIPTATHDSAARWPAIDLEHIPIIKRRLDIKAPSPRPDSSSSSDSKDETTHLTKRPGKVGISQIKKQDSGSSSSSNSEDETTGHIEKKRSLKVHHSGLLLKESQTANRDLDARWPALDLENIPTIKRRLDVKAPSPRPDSSSSSDSEDESTGQTEKTVPQKVHHSGLLLKESQTANRDLDARWPALDLENIPTIKRRLDIKAPSTRPDSSSSSDSDDETIHAAERPGKVGNATLPLQKFPTATHDPDPKWPALDLEHIPTIKRRLDVKAPSPSPDSSSSSESEDETTHLTKRPGKVDISQIKKQDSGSSSSSENDDETTGQTEKKRSLKVHHSGLLLKESQTANRDLDAKWPALDLENIPTIKRRLDIKVPSHPPDSSSSSDSDDETIHAAERPGKVGNATLPLQKFPTATHDPDAKWPALDLEHIPIIKRRLDVKAPSPSPDSSSRSESEDETTHLTKRPGKVDISQIKKQDSSSSSSSENDDETTGQTEKKRSLKVHHSGLLLKESQTANRDLDAKWPALDLENIPTIKRRLDVKAPSPPPDSSSSSDSDDKTKYHTDSPGKVDIVNLPLRKSQTLGHNIHTGWPALDLENIPTIKKHLDVKAPSPRPDSSSSSDSEDETTGHIEKTVPQKVHHSGILLKESQTANHGPDARWPALDLENISTIKRRLDFKAPSPPPDSSSSSESDDERTHHTEKKRSLKVHHSGLLLKESQTANRDLDARWPALDLENITTIKRRLDIKAPSTRPDSSSSSDSDDEATHAAERPGKVGNAALPLQKIPTTTHDSAARWPALDLEHIPIIKRRLDIKAPSPPPDSSSSSDSKDETTHLTKRPGKVDISQIKKQDSGSSSSSENDDETTGHIEKKRSLKVHHSGLLLKESQTANRDLDAKWPALDLENIPTIKRRLEIKAPSTRPDSSSSSDSDDETIHAAERPGKVGNAAPPLQKIPTTTHDSAARWPALDLEHIPTIKRRLDVKAPSPPPDSSSRSDSKDGTTHLTKRPGKVDISLIKKQDSGSSSKSYDPLGSAVNLDHVTRIKRRLDIKAPSSPPKSLSVESKGEGKIKEANKIGPNYSSSSSVEQDKYTEDISNPSMTIKPDPRWPELRPHSAPRIKRHLDIKTHSPSTESSSSSDKSDNESTYLPVKVEGDRTVVGITNYQPGSQFPDSSFSSNANGTLSNHTLKHETDKDCDKITTQEQQKVMHNINLGIPKTRRRLDIKAPSPQPDLVLDSTYADVGRSESNSSTSESEDENSGNKFKWSPKSPLINIPPKPKTDHTIKLEKYTVITDDLRDQPTNDNISPTPEINPELQSRWNNMNLGVSRFRKRLDITSRTNVPPNLPTTPLPDSPSSYMGESGTGNQTSRTRLKKNLVKVTEEKSNQDILLTGFGTPRVRGYLDTKVPEKAPGTSPLHQQSDSVSSSESEGISTEYADYTWRGTSQLRVVPDVAAPTNHTSLLVTHAADESHSGTQVERKAGVELKGQASEEGDGSASMWPHLSLTNIPKVKRALDIRAPLQRESFPGCNSEDETDHTVPELKPGVARINRRLNIKAPSPEPNTSSSSSSESDNEVTGYSAKQSIRSSNMSAMTDVDYSQIAYKRSIIKAPRQRDSFSSSGRSNTSDHPVAQAGLSYRVGDRSASLSPWGVSSIEEQSSLDVSPEIRWTGIGRNLPDFSSLSTRLDLGVPPPQRAPPAEPDLTPPDSSNSSDKIKHDRVKAYESLMHRFSYPTASRGSVASSRSLDKLDNTSRSKNEIFRALSEDRKEKKGLGALKAISSKRLQWDTDDKDKDAV